MWKRILLSLMLILVLVLVACGATPEPTKAPVAEPTKAPEVAPTEAPPEPTAPPADTSGVEELNILWAQWDPADYLQVVGNMYKEETGIAVNIVQEPWGTFYDRAFTEFAAGGDAFDGIVGDSQWLGQGATQGHYVDMTDFLVGEGIADTVTEATLTYYGEYPAASGRYWGFPTEGDADGWAYRKDLFEDPDNMAAFEDEYGYPLAPPEDYDQLLDMAKFFTRPDDGLYGVAIYTQKDYDAVTMGVENTFFTYGADWKDPATNQVQGIVNSPEAIEALEMYRELYDCCQVPGLSNAFYNETNQALINGQAAMAMNYFAFFPALASPDINPYADDTGFFPNPKGPYGDQAAALGGQGLSIVSYASPAQQEAMKDFIRWFAQEDVQAEWAALGGYTCNENVLKTDEFLEATPFNPAFAATMGFVKDFWNIPEYAQLLEVTQRELSSYVVGGEGTAQEALDTIAAEHDVILRDAGYITDAAPDEPAADSSGVEELNILWAQWDPADYLQVVGNMYEDETGVAVNIVQEPWGTFYDRAFTEFAAGGDAFDGVVGDSQWLGQGATQGHYVDMTDFLVGEGIADTVTEATMTYYGEYPAASGKYWGFPTEGDADGWAYRKDLFEDPDNMAAFEAEYGYPLAPPEDYDQLLNIAKFFTRPDDGLYGVAIYTQKDYDAVTMGVENTFFTYGADWKDPATNHVMGIVNSPEAVEALEMYRELYDCCQVPGLSNAFYNETNQALINGQAAMAMNYFAFFPALASPDINPFADDTGFFPNPKGPYGDQAAALGGQGLSIVSYASSEQQEGMRDFIRWFAQEDVQAEWAALGGYTCNKNVLQTDEFLEATPFNPAFAATMGFVKDFWNIPEYAQLLEVTQRELSSYVVGGEGTAQEALDTIAAEHDVILRDAGYITGDAPAPAAPAADTSGVEELNILWAQWDPADYLQVVGNMYEDETGIAVNIVQEPWGTFYDRAFTEFAAGGDAFDGIVGDSQWLGQGATQGHYVDMTDFMVGEGIADSVTEATLTYYGEYPAASGKYWGFPTEGDADGWAYRADLFEDPDNMAAFEAEYGYPLAPPEDYDQLLNIAKFFTRPDDGLYGVAIYTQKDYDAVTMGVENTFFTYGADWKDPATNEVQGIVNSPEAVEALEMYRELYDCCQVPGLSNAFYNETNQALINGQAAMAMNYFAFFPALASPDINPFADTTGFFPNPKGPYGDQAAALGGQGLSIVSYASPEQQEAMRDFIRWFAQEDVQAEWAALGGYTCNENVLKTDEFLEATPFNPAFAATMGFVKDFWNIPEYAQLLEVTQRELSSYVVGGEGTAQEALDTIAAEHDAILREAGYIK